MSAKAKEPILSFKPHPTEPNCWQFAVDGKVMSWGSKEEAALAVSRYLKAYDPLAWRALGEKMRKMIRGNSIN